jgi:hypothetical protein
LGRRRQGQGKTQAQHVIDPGADRAGASHDEHRPQGPRGDPRGDASRRHETGRRDGILGNKRRRYYGHAATLVACCLELAPAAGRQKGVADWVHGLRARYARFSAFQEELENALASISDRR